MNKKWKCFLLNDIFEFDSNKRERSMPLSFIPLSPIRKLNCFEDNLQGYMASNTNICHLLIYYDLYWSFLLFYARNKRFAVYINNNKLGQNSPAHPAVDCQTIYFSDKRFLECTAERNYILLADINWHLVSHRNKILQVLTENASGLKVQYLIYIQ